MNKTQLVDALAARLGDRRTAASAVDGLLETIVDTVRGGESVSLTGFGVFSSRARAARTARNPRTGEAVPVPAATVPAFRPGVGFRTAVGGVTADPPKRARRAGSPPPRTTPQRRTGAAAPVGSDAAGGVDAAARPPRSRTVPPADAPAVNGATVMSPVTARATSSVPVEPAPGKAGKAAKAAPAKTGSAKASSAKTGSAKASSAKTGSAKAGATKPGSTKTAKTAKVAAAKKDDPGKKPKKT